MLLVTGITAANGPTSAPAPADSPEAPSSLPDIPSAGNIYICIYSKSKIEFMLRERGGVIVFVVCADAGGAGSKTVPSRTDGTASSGSSVGATGFSTVVVLMASSLLAFS